jgi:hypothetical protein
MKLNIDMKSAAVGLALGILAMFVIGAGESESSKAAHYQVSTGPDLICIVDTQTGQAWAIRPAGTSITGAPMGFFEKKSR